MKDVRLNTSTVVISKQFNCKDLSNPTDRPDCIMFNSGLGISNDKFPQPVLSEEIEGTIHFEPLNDSMGIKEILSFSNEKMAGSKKVNHALILRALYSLMRRSDPLLRTIKGKRIIVPVFSKENNGRLSVILFDPIYQHEPVWGVELPFASEITGHNTVLPILL